MTNLMKILKYLGSGFQHFLHTKIIATVKADYTEVKRLC